MSKGVCLVLHLCLILSHVSSTWFFAMGIQSCCCYDRDSVGLFFFPKTCSSAASCWLIWTRPHLGQLWGCEGYLVHPNICFPSGTCLWGENHLPKAVGPPSFLSLASYGKGLKPWSYASWGPPSSPTLNLFHFLGLWLHRKGGAGQVGLPGPRCLGWKYFSFYLSTLVPFLFVYIYFYNAHLKAVFFSIGFCTENATLESKVCSGQGGGAGGGALQVHAVHIGCQGFQSSLQNQAWSQIYSLPAVMEFLGSITSLWKEIIQEIASWQVRIAKIHSLESWCLQILFSFGHFSQVHLLGFHLMEAYLGAEEKCWRFTVGILGDTCQRWC